MAATTKRAATGAAAARDGGQMKRSRGRPVIGERPKVAYFNMRTDPALRARVEASARARGVPLVQEVERLVIAALDAQERSAGGGPVIEDGGDPFHDPPPSGSTATPTPRRTAAGRRPARAAGSSAGRIG